MYIHRFVKVSDIAAGTEGTVEWSGRLKQVTERQDKMLDLVKSQITISKDLHHQLE